MSALITSLTIPQASRLRGVSAVHGWRLARGGRWGNLEAGKPARVAIAAIERECGRCFTAEQIAAAIRKPQPNSEPTRFDESMLSILGIAVLGRDQQWRRWLADEVARNSHPGGPADQEFIALIRKVLTQGAAIC
jgi:hypothetical protein